MIRYFAPNEQVLEYVAKKANGKVLELGPGKIPFSKATHFCGHDKEEAAKLDNYKTADFSNEMLPYKNKEFDFIYARHVVEDLYNPINFLKECKRISKAGFFETPSALVELSKYIENDKAVFTGYHHHHSICWTTPHGYNIIHKYPIVEHSDIYFEQAEKFLSESIYWNNYFMWEGDFEYKHWRHEVNYDTIKDYPRLLAQAVNQSIIHTKQFKTLIES